MQITIENFQEKLPTIVNAIRTCEFVAIDCEFTGNLLDMNDKPHEYDTFDDKYRKNKQAVQKFLAFQVGITTFYWSAMKQKYVGRPFNFMVYPRSVLSE